ncbi:MAG: hypothetical protein KHZ62_12245 [Clostridiales bacterium]|nr:hypothetical protein [Clostridiales bacterium]
MAVLKKGSDTEEETISKTEVRRYLQEEIRRREASIEQKVTIIEHINQEIENDKKHIAECIYMLEQREEVE